jgi:hypothetical protein
VDTYIIDIPRAGRRIELEENDMSDTHFRAWWFKGSVGYRPTFFPAYVFTKIHRDTFSRTLELLDFNSSLVKTIYGRLLNAMGHLQVAISTMYLSK